MPANTKKTSEDFLAINELMKAAAEGDEVAVRELLAKGADAKSSRPRDLYDGLGMNPLQAALRNSQFGIAEILMAAGAELGAIVGDETPVAMAMARDSSDHLEALKWIAQNHGVGFLDRHGNTMIHYAAEKGSWAGVEVLLDHGADINARNSYGWTPLHDACGRHDGEMLKLLLSRGADPGLRSRSGHLPLHALASVEGILCAHEQGMSLDEPGPNGLRLIHHKDKYKVTDCFKTLIALGCSTEGCYGVTKEHEEAIAKSRLANAIDTKNGAVLLAHLTLFGAPTAEELKKSRPLMSRNPEMKAIVDAFMAHDKVQSVAKMARHHAP